MSMSDDFAAAQVRVKQLSKPPATAELLALYSLYKQATVGDVQGDRPEPLDFKARAKYDAWATRKAMTRDAAMAAYVALVDKLTDKLPRKQ
ncbi:MAG TPA: acyl-CoA-binding protein [Polyangia bacterium]|jgi:carboxylesterase